MHKWQRLRFTTGHADYRPAIFSEHYPWWCSGYTSDDRAVVVAYLPIGQNVTDYWGDAKDIELTYEANIKFSSRFPRPGWYTPEGKS